MPNSTKGRLGFAGTVIVVGAALALSTFDVQGQSTGATLKRLRQQIASKRVIAGSPATIESATTKPQPAPLVLAAGVPYQVKLEPEVEATATRLVEQHLSTFVGSDNVTMFPGVERQLAAGGAEVQLKAYVLAGQPLTFDEAQDAYIGTIRLGVTSVNGERIAALSAPVQFEVVESNVAEPSRVELNQSSPPFETMQIKWRDAKSAVTVHVASRFNPDGQPVSLPISPRLTVESDRDTIQGYGLETCRIDVVAIGLDKPEGTVVNLRAKPSGHFEEAKLVLGANGTAGTVLRSDGTGPVSIIASAPGLSPGSRTVDFNPPWRTVFSAIIGGLLGGLVRVLPSLIRGTKPASAAITLVVAVIVGLLVFGLCVLGVNTLLIDYKVRVSDIFVLVASAMGAWVGTLALPKPPGKP